MLVHVVGKIYKSKMSGFSLIELMITIALFGVLTALAYSNFSTWVQDTKTRSAAEAIQNAIRIAQTEAVTRGRNVTFLLTDSTPALNTDSSSTGKNWVVKSMSLANVTTSEIFIQGASLSDTKSVVTTASSASIRFNSLGRLVDPTNPVSYKVRNSLSGDSGRKLNVTVSIAGKIRMCDADKTVSATSPDGC